MENIILTGKVMKGHSIPTSNTAILIIQAEHGLLGCGYLSIATAEKVGDAMATVTGVKNFDDMLNAKVQAVSSAAAALGVTTAMTGKEALLKMS